MAMNTKSCPGSVCPEPAQQNQLGSKLSSREAPKEEFFSKAIFCQHELGFWASSGSLQPLLAQDSGAEGGEAPARLCGHCENITDGRQ